MTRFTRPGQGHPKEVYSESYLAANQEPQIATRKVVTPLRGKHRFLRAMYLERKETLIALI
ncbi:hypothetical protein SCHPADRAFT_903862 [Schizopora paradoxa]|uniref:Uncharacterized protein n=1 Tax=Schizopora paradoxa TaxID=27342 RepID=A0A0H2RPI1_9AGAM|nr:hypothetical protein SCHPADRAFT_903862 [Schizopora paradoxa]